MVILRRTCCRSSLPGAIMDVLIKGLLQLQLLPYWGPINLHPKEVYITPCFGGYLLPTFVRYKEHTDPLKHLRRFKHQCGIATNNNTRLLKQFPLSVAGTAVCWYCTLPGIKSFLHGLRWRKNSLRTNWPASIIIKFYIMWPYMSWEGNSTSRTLFPMAKTK